MDFPLLSIRADVGGESTDIKIDRAIRIFLLIFTELLV